jgi:uncharacterized protein (DUF305 family)
MRRRAVVLALLLAVAGCGADPAPPPAFNHTDVMFLQMMLAHHEPAGQLLRLGRERAARADVRAVAAEVADAQAADARTIADLLRDWGQPPNSDAHPDAHAAHGGLPLLDEAELADLAAAEAAQFDTLFLNVLIGHQHRAVELARMETTGGRHPRARELARAADERVRAEIQRLLRLVAGP